MTRRAAAGTLLLALAACASGLALALAVPSITLQDPGTPASITHDNHLEVMPSTIPKDLTSEEINYAKSVFGSDILETFSSSLPTALNLDATPSHQTTLPRPSNRFFRWLQMRQLKKQREREIRSHIENEEKFLAELMNELQQEITQIQSQWTKKFELQSRILQQQTALKGQKEVLGHLEEIPTPYYEPSYSIPWQYPWQSTPTLITSGLPGKIIFSMSGPMKVAANQGPLPAPQGGQAGSLPAARTLTDVPRTPADDAVVTPGIPDSLAQFARSQRAANV